MNALFSNTTGSENTASGASALRSNTTGNYNTASGVNALYSNTTGYNNSASGAYALYYNTTGSYNTASGQGAGYYITTGSKNTILGRYDGTQDGLDIRTANNNIVLSDGDGTPAVRINVGDGYSTEYTSTGSKATSVARMGVTWDSVSTVNLLTVSNLAYNGFVVIKVRILVVHAVRGNAGEIQCVIGYGAVNGATPVWTIGTPTVVGIGDYTQTGTFAGSEATLTWNPGLSDNYYRASIFIDTVQMDSAKITYNL
jgi:hypothetical protein